MSAATVPTLTLNNGVAIPQIGFGVFQVPDDETAEAVTHALEAGYRSIDTAAVYGNERGVASALKNSGLAREDIFLTTKLWNTEQGYDSTLKAFDESLAKLETDYVDLYLIHWPTPERDLYVDTWKAFEKIYEEGRAKAIGVSNFLPEHLQRIADLGGTVPAVNQVELHPLFQQRDVQAADTEHGIATEAWSPLGRGAALGNDVIAGIAEALGRTPAQVILRWHLQAGRIIIPKSVTAERIKENIEILDFELSAEQYAALDGLDGDGRIGPNPAEFNG